jgi:DNA (cytosine-5)-methyltransferase 1
MGILQGFPRDYVFGGASLSNMYRHIGDAVPPLISYQLAWLASWMLTGARPAAADLVLPGTHLTPEDIQPAG